MMIVQEYLVDQYHRKIHSERCRLRGLLFRLLNEFFRVLTFYARRKTNMQHFEIILNAAFLYL